MSLVLLFVMGLCMWWWLFRPKLSACKTSVARGPVRIVRQENFWILWFICYLQLNVTKQTGCGGEAYTALSPVHTRECIGWFAKACWCLSGLQHRILPRWWSLGCFCAFRSRRLQMGTELCPARVHVDCLFAIGIEWKIRCCYQWLGD